MRKLPDKFLAAMIAVRALPGSPMYSGNDTEIMDEALQDLELYKKYKVDSIILENDHDLPYMKPPLDPKGIALMTKICKKVRKNFDGPIGVQMLEAANEDSLKIALEADLDFIRVEGYVFAHIGNSGLIEGCSGKLQRLRTKLDAKHIKIFADVKKKHCAHAITADLDITDEIKQAEYSLVDGVIVTSKFTGIEPDTADLKKARGVTKLPVIIGSGMTDENIETFLPLADGFIVGTVFRENGEFLGKTDEKRLREFMKKFIASRKGL